MAPLPDLIDLRAERDVVVYGEYDPLLSNYDDADGGPDEFDLRPYESRVYDLR